MNTIFKKKGIFFSIKHLMSLEGIEGNKYSSAQKRHQAIRDALAISNHRKKKLTIKEYCEHVGLDEEQIIIELRERGFKDV